jgi:hypothetical protein
MSEGISFYNNDDIEKHLKLVMSQTNYTEDEARNKLKQFNSDYMKVLKDYMNLDVNKKEMKIKSVNQEMFKQMRNHLDSSMREYREQNPINMHQVINNFNEEDGHENK